MKKVKGFVPSGVTVEPVPLEVPTEIPVDRLLLEQMMLELTAARLSPRCVGCLKNLASIPPTRRLARNLREAVDALERREAADGYGLTLEERLVLRELDASPRVSSRVRDTAYALFNFSARKALIDVAQGAMAKARMCRGWLEKKPFD